MAVPIRLEHEMCLERRGAHGVVFDIAGRNAMATFREMRVLEIVEDGSMTTEQKIAELREIESEARGLQRAASESPMGDDDGWQDDLRQVRLALDKLGAKEPKKGAASL
jgi:predicted Fe-Mo cluster-binding NifX family protein